ncbi:apolipoprotein N-acyltransferase [Novosphingobium capsulatum]|uniref:apolipoprotein N-acyltransferase n=1 Tax=Novosphingobium capsulatum TaxID=13688 RepID=UPI000B20F847|nr:apolipoprotein N-acyltransferase [Novosphingobium capsulatum]WQD93353.1 apolipoprotein N-acyltransferase [Novosphingobium capsulatum]
MKAWLRSRFAALVALGDDRLSRRSEAAVLVMAGGLGALGFAPLNWWPLTLLALAVLAARMQRARGPVHALLVGELWGWGHFSVGNGWIATAFTYQAQMPAWLGWIAVLLLAVYLALFPAVATLAAWWLGRRWRLAPVPALAALWIVTEWARGWVCTGFPWNPLAATALGGFDRPGLARVLPWLGTYALSGLVVLLAGQWLFALRAGAQRRWGLAAAHFALPAVLFLLPLGGQTATGSVPFTLVQPNIGQDEINDASRYEEQFQRAAALSLPRQPGQRRLVLWPESGVPDYLQEGYPRAWYAGTTYGGDPLLARARMGRVVGPGALLLTGAVDLVFPPNPAPAAMPVGAWNVVTAIDSQGVIQGHYAKAHLVPYGEYLPMRGLLTPLGLSRLVAGDFDYWSGPGPRTLDFSALGLPRVGVQVCYEIIFSGQVIDRAHRPDVLFNPTNDGWFGAWGPPQHLAQARLRAIEEGLPVLRSTTNGISAVIDARGGVRAFAPQHVASRIEGLVPPALPPTPFARMGNILPLLWAAALLLAALVASRRRPR